MARNKEAFIFLLDVGTGTNIVSNGDEKPFVAKSVDCIGRVIQRKIFAESKDDLGIITFGTKGTKNPMAADCDLKDFKHIYVERNFTEASWDLYNYAVSKNRTEVTEGDWLKALYAAIDYFDRQVTENGKKYKSLTISLFTNFLSPCAQDKVMLDNIIKNLRENRISLYFIGPEIPTDGDFESASSEIQKQGMITAAQIIGALSEASLNITFEEAEVQFATLPKKKKKAVPWNANLRLAPNLEIAVSGFIAVKKETLPSWKEEVADRPGVGVERERTHVKKDVEMTEVPEEEIISGYQYGTKIIPFSIEDEEEMAYKAGEKDFTVICYVDASSIHPHYYVGDNTMYVIARKEDKRAQLQLSALIHALSESGQVAIVRRVYQKRSRPKIGFLGPVIHLHAEHLIYTQLPYSEDVRQFRFPPLSGEIDRLSSEQNDAVDDLISNMDLSNVDGEEALRSVDILDPYIQYVYRVLSHRQLQPEEPLREFMEEAKTEAMASLEQPEEVKAASEDAVKKVAEVFPTEVIVKKKRKVEELGIGQRDGITTADDAASGSSGLQQPTTQDLNISDILGSKITAVGTMTPVADFQALISRGEDTRLACIQLEDVVIRLVVEAPPVNEHHLVTKAVECLTALRAYCVKVDPAIFNVWIKRLKQAVLEKKNFGIFERMEKDNIGPISRDENPSSAFGKEEIAEFYSVEEKANAAENEPEAVESEENLLDEL